MNGSKLALIAGGVLVAIQLVPLQRTNPPVEAALKAPDDVQAVFDRSCIDCHSHATKWPWYAYVAPVSWLVVHDTNEGRRHMNFSKWGTYSEKRRRKKARQVWDEVEEGDMPIASYLLMHPGAKLSGVDRATLRAWSEATGGPPEAGDEEHDHEH